MEKLSHIEFMKFYKTNVEPLIISYTEEIKSARKRANKKLLIVVILSLILGAGVWFFMKDFRILFVVLLLCLVLIGWANMEVSALLKKFKLDVGSKVLSLCGNVSFSDKKNAVKYYDIRKMGLFPNFTSKTDDDVIVGEYKGCKFLINECRLVHYEQKQHGDTRSQETKTDFNGLIFKVQMNKNFQGKTIVGLDFKIRKMRGFDEVKLESIQFMRGRKIYSTDQVEARYILTTTFMEKLDELGQEFWKHRFDSDNQACKEGLQQVEGWLNSVNSSSDLLSKGISTLVKTQFLGVSAAFIEGYMYLFIPLFEGDNMFEILEDRNGEFNNPDCYYKMYSQLWAFLSLIDYMKLDKHLGL